MLKKSHKIANLIILFLIWLVGAVCDRLWFSLDHSVPAWDQAEYLNGAMNYTHALQQPHWLDKQWWISFWQLSTKVPPLTFIATAVVQQIFGIGLDQATIVNLFFSAILLVAVYGLGVQLFNAQVGLWAAVLCQILPGLYKIRLEYLLDYPLTAFVTLSFWCLTVWRGIGRTAQGQRSRGAEEQRGRGAEEQRGRGAEGKLPFTFSLFPFPFSLSPPTNYQLGIVWFWAAAFGISFGLALLVKQTALFFLLTPVLWVGIEEIRRRNGWRIFQLIIALLLAVAVIYPWYRTNWLLILTGGKRATVDSALQEGDPPLNTLAAWTYYWQQLPVQVSWLLLLVPIVGMLLYWTRSRRRLRRSGGAEGAEGQRGRGAEGLRGRGENQIQNSLATSHQPLATLLIFWIGAYLLCSLNINKDERYVLPYLPAVSLFLAYAIACCKGRWGKRIRWGTIGIAVLLMFLNLFPVLPNSIMQILSPNAQHYAYMGQFPHAQVIEEIIQTAPYISSTLGVLPSTPEINQHNLNYYGALQNFQVYGRQVGTQKKQIYQDARSLGWFLTKTGNQGSVPPAQAHIVQMIEHSPAFYLHKSWDLPDRSTLKLYHNRTPLVEVQPSLQMGLGKKVSLSSVIVPTQAPPGKPVPVTYEWSGSWEQLQTGLVLLTWHQASPNAQHRWLHDHAIAMGTLVGRAGVAGEAEGSGEAEGALEENPTTNYQYRRSSATSLLPITNYQFNPIYSQAINYHITERMSMLPPEELPAGTYTLDVQYLNRKSGETYPISVPPVTLKIDSNVAATPAPELDLLTQLRNLAAILPQGTQALEQVFAEIGRINQYDPIQDYLVQVQQAMEYRLLQEPKNQEWAYTLALANVLLQNVNGAIAAFETVTGLDSKNPYAYAYLAFVHLYNWNGAAAQAALKRAMSLQPNLPELQTLSGIAALMQGNLLKAWHYLLH